MQLTSWETALFRQECLRLARKAPLERMAPLRQHGQISCLRHSLAVARLSFALACRLHMDCNCSALLRGALLHDFFLYDWRIPSAGHPLHAFTHPRRAVENARRYCRLGKREENIILRHMFPLTPVPPRYREGWLVCLADKICSLEETASGRFARPRCNRDVKHWRKSGYDDLRFVSVVDLL